LSRIVTAPAHLSSLLVARNTFSRLPPPRRPCEAAVRSSACASGGPASQTRCIPSGLHVGVPRFSERRQPVLVEWYLQHNVYDLVQRFSNETTRSAQSPLPALVLRVRSQRRLGFLTSASSKGHMLFFGVSPTLSIQRVP